MEFTVRKYHPEDFTILWKIDQSCFPPGISYTRYELATYIRRSTALTLVAETENPVAVSSRGPESGDAELGQVLGFIIAERLRSLAGHIVTIDVRAEARRSRVGSTLLAAAEEQLRLWNCRSIQLETAVDNSAALSFYKRHGFDVVRVVPRYYSNGLDALLLEKHLLSPHPSR